MERSDAQRLYLWLVPLVLVVFFPLPTLVSVALWVVAAFMARRIVVAHDLDRVGLVTIASAYPLLVLGLVLVATTGRALSPTEVLIFAVMLMIVQGYGLWRLMKSVRPPAKPSAPA